MGVVIVGAGGHGRDILATAQAAGVECVLCDESVHAHAWPVPEMPHEFLAAVNDPAARRALVERLGWPGARLVDPSARVGPGCSLGEGVVVAANAVLLRDVDLGTHVHVNYGATMTRTTVGAFSTVAPGATICGDVWIGDECFVGAGAVIKNLVTVGDGVTIGAGAVVVADVPNGACVKGIPAR